jgi:hypothetical protein
MVTFYLPLDTRKANKTLGEGFVDASAQTRSEQSLSAIERHLRTATYEKNLSIHGSHRDTALKASGEWLYEETAVDSWLSHKTRLLAITGGPGAGKSYLASSLSERLNSTYKTTSSRRLARVFPAYFYIKEYDQDLRDLSNILKTIAYQIALMDAVYQSHTVSVVREPDAISTARRLWDNLFVRFFNRPDSDSMAMIVLDGLDELPSQTLAALYGLVEDIAEDQPNRISLAFFSRPEVSEFWGPKLSRDLLRLEIGARNGPDIASYIKHNVTRILVVAQIARLKNKKAAAKLAREIRDQVVEKADNMFIKVVLIMNQLYDKERVAAVFEAIELSPPRLDELISQVFDRILAYDDVNSADFRELLIWVSASKRPLTIAELYEVLRLRSGSPNNALESRLRGRFASIFRLGSKPSPLGSDLGGAINPAWTNPDNAADTEEVGISDIDDIDDISSEEESDLNDTGQLSLQSSLRSGDSKTLRFLSKTTIDRFKHTEVMFTHLTIRDFLGTSRKTGISEGWKTLGIPFHPGTSQLQIARGCIEHLIADPTNNLYQHGCDYVEYACDFLPDHILSIKSLDGVADSERRALTKSICQLLLHKPGTTSFIRVLSKSKRGKLLLDPYFEKPAMVSFITAELFGSVSEDEVSSEEWSWIQECQKRPRDLLKPLAVRAATIWLEDPMDDTSYTDDSYTRQLVRIVYSYMETVSRHMASLQYQLR